MSSDNSVHKIESVPKYPKLGSDPVDDIVAAMTLSEKASMLSGYYKDEYDTPDENGNKTVRRIKLRDAAGCTQAISRYGIPSVQMIDGPAGVRFRPFEKDGSTYYATAYPVETLLASTWDVQLIEEVGQAFGSEAAVYGIDLLLAPALNIQRNPLGGRNFEYFSEDPLLSGKMAAAMVRGIQSVGVGATIKHFAANNQETNRTFIDEIIEERTMREIYLRGFEIAVKESRPWVVMSAYNQVNGEYAATKSELLTDILRGEWGFDGMVITDWGQKGRFYLVIKAQNDLVMPHGDIWDAIRLQNVGFLSMEEIDRCVRNILNFVVKTRTFKNVRGTDLKNLKNNYAGISRKAAAQGMILLKNNDNTLPLRLSENQSVALYGMNQCHPIKGGSGSGDVYAAYTVSLREGLEKANIGLNPDVRAIYSADAGAEPAVTAEQAASHAADIHTAAALIAIGRNSGEENDRSAVKGDYYLTDAEAELIKTVSDAFHAAGKKTAVILNIGGVIDMESWKDRADAILLAWQPGQECGDAIADVLTGKVNPSGKLPMTIAKAYGDYPTSAFFPGNGLKVEYGEGIYVGYRYFTTWEKPVTYEFGFGLSYTTFEYSGIKSKKTGENTFHVSVTVKNTGSCAGREVVQLYVSAPEQRIEKPVLELKAFAKTRLLQPGDCEHVSLKLDAETLKSYDVKSARWIAEAGVYRALVGSSCLDIRGTAVFELKEDVLVQQIANRAGAKQSITVLSKKDKK